ncbi:MAG: transposase [Acidobacteria bacterium]|nr:transposase [Acidobacteriota bacterium]
MKTPTPHRLLQYVRRGLRLKRYLQRPGDGRRYPQIPAPAMLWAILLGQILRECSFHAVESLVGCACRRRLGVSRKFGDDALAYFGQRLNPAPTRQAAVQVVRQAKRNKAFQNSTFLGLAVDGTTAGRCREEQCSLCRPLRDAHRQIVGYRHHFVMLSVVGTGLSLPIDVEPYGPGDSEYAAGQRLLRRAIPALGSRFADYLVVDGEFATAPFLHACDDLGLPVVARLKGNLPELFQAAQQRFSQHAAKLEFRWRRDRVQVWDADDFDPWESLRWSTVRVLYYRQQQPDGTVIEAHWLTNLSPNRVSTRSLFRMVRAVGRLRTRVLMKPRISTTWNIFLIIMRTACY